MLKMATSSMPTASDSTDSCETSSSIKRLRQFHETDESGGSDCDDSSSEIPETDATRIVKRKGKNPKKKPGSGRKCKYKAEWAKQYPWSRKCSTAEKGAKAAHYAWCIPCGKAMSIVAGSNELLKHSKSTTHREAAKVASTTRTLPGLFSLTPTRTLRAEILFAQFLAEHHIPFLTTDHFHYLCKEMFPDSEVAKRFRMHRTKATAITVVTAHTIMEEIRVKMEGCAFSIALDEATTISVEKLMVVMLRFFDRSAGQVRCIFQGLVDIPDATAEGLFSGLDTALQSGQLSYEHLIAGTTDGASVMRGRSNSVTQRLKLQQPHLFDLHCPCHAAALIASAASSVLPDTVEQLVRDVYSHFHLSPKRQLLYKEFQSLCDLKPHKILKLCQTRWLSAQQVIDRTLEQYDGINSYFQSCTERLATVRRIQEMLRDPITKAYLLFLHNILPIINHFNLLMQRDEPMIHLLHTEMENLLLNLLSWFIKPHVLQSATEGEVPVSFISRFVFTICTCVWNPVECGYHK